MNLIDQHIRKHLSHFQDEEDSSFQEIIALIQSKEKDKNVLLLRYIHLLLNESLGENSQETKTLHLHFEYDLDNYSALAIAHYLLVRIFIESKKNNASTSDESNIQKIKTQLSSRLRKLSVCPDGASGKNGGNKIYKNWIKEKKEVKALLDFYKQFDNKTNISTNSIFNCQVRTANSLNEFLSTNPYASTIDNYKNYPTFGILNTKLTLNQIDEIDNSIIDNLETVILFDCERKSLMQNFSLKDIEDFDINLKKYLVISFGNKQNSVQNLRDKLTLIQDRFKIPKGTSYPILQAEINYTLNLGNKKDIPVSFIGIENSSFWDAFLLETSIQDLYELRSIKMMNLYSLCFNEEFKGFILNDLFSNNDTSEIISDETKQRLLDLNEEDILTLKNSLENVLDLIIHSEFKQELSTKLNNETILIVDDFIIKRDEIKQLLFSALELSIKNKLRSWSDLKDIEGGDILILSYQDQGKFPYYFYPNVIETTVSNEVTIYAIYHKFLFSNRYQWAKYYVAKDIHKLTNHPIRQKYFQWQRLKDSINDLRPQNPDNTNWDLEQQYSGNTEREIIKLKLKGERERTYNSSDFFIYSFDEKQTFRVDKIGFVCETLDEDDTCYLLSLDEIQESINLFEKMVDTSQQEGELNIIRQQFQLNDSETGRLWKLLLKKRALSSNEETLYNELKTFLENKGLKIVSSFHFKNNWLNPESESIAPLSKKVFIELCNFLNLPKTYFILIQRLRNASKQSNRQSTRQMNRLLQDLFNDGCFDEKVDTKQIITKNLENYKKRHLLDELGIDEKYLGENLIALVELIRSEVKLKELEKFKKIE